MSESGRRANQYENAVHDLVEAEVLKDRVGETFDAVVVEVDDKDPRRGEVTIQDPAVEARVQGTSDLPLGERVTVELTAADPASRSVELTLR
jgi:exoribonuclease R